MRALKTFFPLLIVLTLVTATDAIAQWEWHNPVPEANEFFGSAVRSQMEAWFVGENGSIVYSNDGGASWNTVPNPLRGTPLVFLSIIFTDSQTAMISANNGNILRSLDGGATWQALSPPSVDVQRLKQAPDGSVWGFGSNGSIARTTNVGDSWTEFTTGISTIVYDIAFIDGDNVLAACGEGKLLRTTNRGQDWTETVPGVTTDLLSIEFIDADRGFMLQRSKVLLRTTDGGQTWSDTTFTVNLMRQVRFYDENIGWILTNSLGNIYKTTDGGMSWNIVTADPTTKYSFQNIVPVTADVAMVCGIGGNVFWTTNGGANWDQAGSALTRDNITAVTGLSEDESWAFGERFASYTSDGGQTWQGNAAPADESFITGYALSGTRLIGGGDQGQLFLSTNAGTDWTLVTTLTGAGAIEQIDFVDQSIGWCVGPHGTVGRTTDGGDSWESVGPGVTDDFHAISGLSDMEAWIVGNGGKMYFTTNGGQDWSLRALSTQSNLRAIKFIDATNAWAGGDFILLRSTNGGTSWDLVPTTGIDVVYDIEFTDDTTGYVLGSRALLRTKDGGDSFYRTDYPGSHLNDIDPLANGYAWLATGYGGILRYTPAPVIRVLPAYIDFGDVATNRNNIKSFEVQSVGEVPLDYQNVAVLGTDFYVQDGGTPRLIPPGGSETITIRFEPQNTGYHRGIASAISNAVMGNSVVDLVGNGITPPDPAFSHSPDTLDFGEVRLCDLAEDYVRIENVSQKNILVDSAAFFGGDSTSFLVSLPPSGFFTPGKIDSIGVLFVPRAMGPLSSTLIVASNDPGEPYYRIPVKGVGINPVITTDRDVVNFGYVFVPQGKPETITITNTGTAPLQILSWSITGPDAADFAVTKDPTSPVAIGASTEIEVTYTASEPFGARDATLSIETDDCLMLTKEIALEAKPTSTGIGDGDGDNLPSGFALAQNYPNPFSASLHGATTMKMTLPVRADVTVNVYNTLGHKVRTLTSSSYAAGDHELTLGAAGLLPGTYFVELNASARGSSITKRIRVVMTK